MYQRVNFEFNLWAFWVRRHERFVSSLGANSWLIGKRELGQVAKLVQRLTRFPEASQFLNGLQDPTPGRRPDHVACV